MTTVELGTVLKESRQFNRIEVEIIVFSKRVSCMTVL